MSIRGFMDVYGNFFMSMESMGQWGEYGGLSRININMWVSTGIYGAYESIWGVLGVYG